MNPRTLILSSTVALTLRMSLVTLGLMAVWPSLASLTSEAMGALLEAIMEVTMAMEVTTMATITTPGRVITNPGLTMVATMEEEEELRYRHLSLDNITGEEEVTTAPRGWDTLTR